ncbi:MAG: DUF1361 domain-containing protein [Cyanobacteria bacterium J06588_5]
MLPSDLSEWIWSSLHAANRSMLFMLWNEFLALIPFVLSLWLFRRKGTSIRRLGWWIGLAVFVAFLPNAPYVLTDIIHIVKFIREGTPMWTVVLVLVPQYLIFMLIGVEAYVAALVNMGHYLTKQGWSRWVLPAELLLHTLCAIGIYIGRFPRFNSWDLVTVPHKVLLYTIRALLNPESLAVMMITALIIAAVYWPMKQMTLAMMLYVRSGGARRYDSGLPKQQN